MNFSTFSTPPKEWVVLFLPRTACRRDTPWTSPTRTKLAENLWNTFEHLRATWISVEPRSLLVTRHDPSTFRKIGSKNAIDTNFWNCSQRVSHHTGVISKSGFQYGKFANNLFSILKQLVTVPKMGKIHQISNMTFWGTTLPFLRQRPPHLQSEKKWKNSI